MLEIDRGFMSSYFENGGWLLGQEEDEAQDDEEVK